MRIAKVLDLSPSVLNARGRDACATTHVVWTHTCEAWTPPRTYPVRLSKAAHRRLYSWDQDRLADVIAYMTPGDRGISRMTEAKQEIPRSIRDSIDRRIRLAMRRIDGLNGSAGAATERAFADLRSRLMAKAQQLASGRGDLTATMERETDRAIATELRAFERRVKSEYDTLVRRASRAGVALADAPVDILGLSKDRIPPPVDLDNDDLFASLRDRYAPQQQDKITRKLNQVRRGDIGFTQAMVDLRSVIDSPMHAAGRILRTETSRAAQKATQDRLDDHSKTIKRMRKEWVSALVSTTRPAHAAAHGQIVDVDENYTVGGESTPYPKGPGLSAGNAVNCLCLSVADVSEAEVDVDALLAA